MKIVIIVYGFPPDVMAGTELATSYIAKHLTLKGHKVDVIVTQRKIDSPKKERQDGYCVWRIRGINIPKLRLISQIISVSLIILRLKPDLFHGQAISPGGLIATIWGKILRKPSVTFVQGRDLYHWSDIVRKFVLKNTNKIISYSTENRRKIQKIFPKIDVSLIPYGIELGMFDLSKKVSRKELNIKESEKVILFVGRLFHEKGIEYLIQAMEKIKQHIQNIKLIIIGQGPLKDNLSNLADDLKIKENIYWTGLINPELIPTYMKAADVFVLPSIEEPFGVVIVEAMAAGLPVVATNVGGIPDTIEDGVNGYLIEPKNPRQIARKIIELLNDKNLSEKMSQANTEKAQDYNWPDLAARMESIYLRIKASTTNRLY